MNENQTKPAPAVTGAAALVIGVAMGLYGGAVSAQSLSNSNQSQNDVESALLNEMIVTATRRQEVQNTVPISVTAITGDKLREARVQNIQDLHNDVPNLTVNNALGGDNAAIMNIRGLVQASSDSTLDTAVGVYQDDVFLARSFSVLGQLLDVERVEVLRGPQGTLFGRNTIGGAIQIVSKKPQIGAGSDAYVNISAGNHGLIEASAASTFQMGDSLAVRIAANVSEHDGHTTSYLVDDTFNPATGQFGYVDGVSPVLEEIDTDNRDTVAYRASIAWLPTESTSVDLSFYHYEDDTNGVLLRGRTGDLGSPNLAVGDLVTAGRGFSSLTADDFYSGLTPLQTNGDAEVDIAIATIEHQISDDLSVKVIASNATAENNEVTNTDGLVQSLVGAVPAPATVLLRSLRDQEVEQSTLEIQMSGTVSDSINWIAGIYYFEEESIDIRAEALRSPFFETTPAALLPPPVQQLAGGIPSTFIDVVAENESASIYGSVDWALNDALTLRFGGRYTEDTKGYIGQSVRAGGVIPPGVELCVYTQIPTSLAPCLLTNEADFENFTWDISADYRFSGATFGYAKVGTGYRTGGISLNANNADTAAPFNEDEVISYELGLKSDIGDRAHINAALFYVDYTDVQQNVLSSFANSCARTLPEEQVIITCNLGDAESYGFELEGVWQISDAFGMLASLGYTNFEYDDPNTLPTNSPEWALSISGIYSTELMGYPLRGILTYQASDDSWSSSDSNLDEVLNLVEGYSLLNARLTLQVNENMSLSLWGSNLTEDEYYRAVTTASSAFGLFNAGLPGAPRTFGLDVKYDF